MGGCSGRSGSGAGRIASGAWASGGVIVSDRIAEPFMEDTLRKVVLATRSWVPSLRADSFIACACAVRLTDEPVSHAMPPVMSTMPEFSVQT